jgi:hypothetical protein
MAYPPRLGKRNSGNAPLEHGRFIEVKTKIHFLCCSATRKGMSRIAATRKD